MSFERRALEANTRWELGAVRLAPGGDVHVEVVEDDAEGLRFSILCGNQQRRWLNAQGTSELLPVGSYWLQVWGKTSAAQSIPFEIRAGETTRVNVRVRPGVRQRFDIALEAKIEPAWCSLRILRGADVVTVASAKCEEGKPCIAEAYLDPGEYTLAVKYGDLEGSTKFTVAEREAEPVRIEVPQPGK